MSPHSRASGYLSPDDLCQLPAVLDDGPDEEVADRVRGEGDGTRRTLVEGPEARPLHLVSRGQSEPRLAPHEHHVPGGLAGRRSPVSPWGSMHNLLHCLKILGRVSYGLKDGPQNAYIEAPTPNVTILGSLRWWLR